MVNITRTSMHLGEPTLVNLVNTSGLTSDHSEFSDSSCNSISSDQNVCCDPELSENAKSRLL